MNPSLGICQGHLLMAAQSPINLCRSLERLLPRMMMMPSSGRASLFMIILVFWWLIFRRPSDSDPSPSPAHGSETSPGPSTPPARDPTNGEESYLGPSSDAYLILLYQLHALRLNPPLPKIVVAWQHRNQHHHLRTLPVPSKGCIAFSI